MSATYQDIALASIQPHEHNVRRDLGDLTELADSIKGMGVLQPLTIAPRGEGYVLIAGHRRHAAALQAGVDTVPCIVRTDLDNQAKQIEAMLCENLQRTDLTVMEEADAYAQLELLGVSEVAIAKTTGRSRKTVHERMLLASLPTERREQFEEGRISLDGAVKCAKLRQQYADDTEILELIDKAGSYSFSGSGYGIDYQISRVLEDRNRTDEPEEDDEDTIDYAGKRAEREAEWERQRQARQERLAAFDQLRDRVSDWLSGRLAVSDEVVLDRLMDWACEELLSQFDTDRTLPIVGIDPCGEDEDEDDANLRIDTAVKALPSTDKLTLIALTISGALDQHVYNWQTYGERISEIGYPLTKVDRALLAPQGE